MTNFFQKQFFSKYLKNRYSYDNVLKYFEKSVFEKKSGQKLGVQIFACSSTLS